MSERPELTPEQDCAVAREALAAGDLRHAVHHLAAALAGDPLRPEFLAVAERLLALSPANTAALVSVERGAWFGLVALRAWLLARTGEVSEALSLLFQVAAVRPDVPYLAWAEGWLEEEEVARAVDEEVLAGAVARFANVVDVTEHPRTTAAALEVLARVHAVQGHTPELLVVHARLLRLSGREAEALALAQRFEAAHPGYWGAVAVANAQRALGRLEEAIAAFRRAAAAAPEDTAAQLDIADLLWEAGRLEESLGTYEAVLAREPEQPWALPSALCLRAHLRDDAAAARRLRQLAQTEEGEAQERAQSCWQLLSQAGGVR